MGLSFTISTIALGIGLAGGGAFHRENIAVSALAILPSLLGMWLGTMVRGWISAATFRRWFLWCLVLLGIELIIRPLV